MPSATTSPLPVGSWVSRPLPLLPFRTCAHPLRTLAVDEYLSAPGALEHALLMLLDAPLFTAHLDRMIDNVVASIADPSASSATLFISLMLALYLKDSTNPLTAMTQASSSSAVATASAGPRKKGKSKTSAGITVGSSKIFRRMRRRWKEVVPVLMKWVWDAAVVEVDQTQPDQVPQVDGAGRVKHLGMPAEGWEERVGTTATAVLYEMCRVQKLDPEELGESPPTLAPGPASADGLRLPSRDSRFLVRICLASLRPRRADSRRCGRDIQLHPHQAHHRPERAVHGLERARSGYRAGQAPAAHLARGRRNSQARPGSEYRPRGAQGQGAREQDVWRERHLYPQPSR